jgi:hypothetical protein
MAELKTRPTGASVTHFISAIPDPVRRGDCRTLASLMTRATGAKAEMWGPSIVGFGRFHYRYDSGREGDWFLAGFSPRKQDLTVYVMGGLKDNAALLAKLGKHKTSAGCLYLKRLAEVDLSVLEKLVAHSAATLRAMHTPATKPAKPAKATAAAPGRARPTRGTAPESASVKPAKATVKPAARTPANAKPVKSIQAVKPARPKRAGSTARVGAVPATRRGR